MYLIIWKAVLIVTNADILNHFKHVRQRGSNHYVACCPAHDDRHPSLSITFADNGKVLIHCFAGCQVTEVLAAAGLNFRDLFDHR